ncbi:uncharacterized protein LOC125668178 [Ostrea edulis]|uniref:uncharacterized protein LOC125668178 n=1 Tax=Ostrea edulis TaxID=37623 RepID=UPI0024AEA352|nr:uncharacterized protein LOC125668178 [Ostrea edulis]
MTNPGLMETITGLTKEKIHHTIIQRETTHIEVLKECHLVKKGRSAKEIAASVLGIGLEAGEWRKLNVEFVSVCRFVLEIDNPWVDELHMLSLVDSVEKEWIRLTEKIHGKELKPSEYYRGKPYEDEIREYGDEGFQLKKIEEQMEAYFPIDDTNPDKSKLQKCVHKLQNECNRCWIEGDEFGGYLKGPECKVPYVFGTENMIRVLRTLMHSFEKPSEGNPECFESLKEIKGDLDKLKFEFCCICVSHDRQLVKKTGIKDTDQKRILEALKELDKTPLNKSEIIRALTRHSVGILHWQNHCQATVTCVGENTVLAPAHIFEQDKSEIWNHLLLMFSEKYVDSDMKALNKAQEAVLHHLRQRRHDDEKKMFSRKLFKEFITSALDNIRDLEKKTSEEIVDEIWENLENDDKSSSTGTWDRVQSYCQEYFASKREEQQEEEAQQKRKKTIKKMFCQLKQRRHNEVAEKRKFSTKFVEFIKDFDLDSLNIRTMEAKKTEVLEEMKDDSLNIRTMEAKKTEVLEEMKDEIEKLENIKDEDLVNLQPNEMRIHTNYTKDVHDHFRENCCRYYVDKVLLMDHVHDFALLRIAESGNLKEDQELFSSQKLVPMAIDLTRNNKDHMYVAAHPFRRTLTIENFVKLLANDEKKKFVVNFHIHALMHAVSRNNDVILRHIPESLKKRVPCSVYRHKYEMDDETKCLIKRSYSEGDLYHHKADKKTRIKVNAKSQFFVCEGTELKAELPEAEKESTSKKLLISVDSLNIDDWREYSLKEFSHSGMPKRKSLQIPIPAAAAGSSKPYRMIITSRREQTSIACEVTADGGKDGKGSLRLKKLDCALVVVEKTRPLYLSVVCEQVYVPLEITDGILYLKSEKGLEKMEGKGKMDWENIEANFQHKPDGKKSPVYSLRLGEACHLHDVSFTLQKDSMGNLSLHYSCMKGKVKYGSEEFLLCLEKEELVKIVLEEDEKNNSCKTVKINLPICDTPNEDQCCLQDQDPNMEERSADNDKGGKMKRKWGRYFREKRKESIRLERGSDDKWSVNILMKRKLDIKSTDRETKFRYYNLIVTKDGETLTWRAEGQKSRTWKLSEAGQDLPYFVWPTDSLSSCFQFQFKREKESLVTLSFNTSSDKYRILQFDSNGRRDYKHLIRQVNTASAPTVSGDLFYMEHVRLEKISTADKTRRFVETLNRSLSVDNLKEKIITKEVKDEGEKIYMESDKFDHLKLIDMEYGASGGACCYLDNQGQVILHGMFLGACPSFYYNDDESKVFFHKTGTCINKILLSKTLDENLKKRGIKIKGLHVIQSQS